LLNIKMTEIKQVKPNEVKQIREKILKDQGGACAICGKQIIVSTGQTLDHQHKLKSKLPGPDGDGLIRGVLCRACNTWEGKIWNSTTRFKKPANVQERIEELKSLVEYYEKGTYPLIHPREQVKEPKIAKRKYNQLKKAYRGTKKFPPYPKSGRMTIRLKRLFEEYAIEPYYGDKND